MLRRRFRRPFRARQPSGSKWMIGYPGVREPNSEHRDAPLSARGRIIWWTLLGLLALGFIALIVLTR